MGDTMAVAAGAGLGLAALIALASVVGAQTSAVHKTTLQGRAPPAAPYSTPSPSERWSTRR